MRKQISRIALVLVSCALVAACGQDKKLAEAALMKADEAVKAASPDIAQYAADSWKGVTDSLKAAQDAFARKDYKGALTGANEIAQKIQEASSVAMAKKDELTKAWTEHERRAAEDGRGDQEPGRHPVGLQEAPGGDGQGQARGGEVGSGGGVADVDRGVRRREVRQPDRRRRQGERRSRRRRRS